MTERSLQAVAVGGIGRVVAGDDLAEHITPGLTDLTWPDGTTGLRDGDVVVVTSKIVSKSEGMQVPAAEREHAIAADTVRIVAERIG